MSFRAERYRRILRIEFLSPHPVPPTSEAFGALILHFHISLHTLLYYFFALTFLIEVYIFFVSTQRIGARSFSCILLLLLLVAGRRGTLDTCGSINFVPARALLERENRTSCPNRKITVNNGEQRKEGQLSNH